MAKLNSEKQKNYAFMKEKSLLGSTRGNISFAKYIFFISYLVILVYPHSREFFNVNRICLFTLLDNKKL